MKKKVFTVMLTAFTISVIIGLILILTDFYEYLMFQLFATFFSLSGFSLTTLCSLVIRKRKKRKLIAKTGVAISVIGYIYTLLIIWNILNYENQIVWNIFLSFITLAFFIGYISVLLFVKNSFSSINISRNIAILLAIFLNILLFLDIWYVGIPIKLILAIIILIIACTLIMMLFISLHDTESKIKVYETSKYKKMDELKELLDTAVISREQFDKEKDRILGSSLKKN